MSDLPAGWTTVALGDHIEILSGFAFPAKEFSGSGSMPVIRIRDVVRGHTETYYDGEWDPRFLVQPGELLIGMDGDFNRERWKSEPALLNQRVCKVTANGKTLDQSFLYHLLRPVLQDIWDSTSYATVKHLSAKRLREATIPLPPLDEQRRIATILDEAASILNLREGTLEKLSRIESTLANELILSAEQTFPLGELLQTIDSGKSPVCEDRPANDNEWSVLKLGAISSGIYKADENKALRPETEPTAQLEVHEGDVLFSRKNTRDLVGATALVRATPAKRLLPDLIFRLVIRPESKLMSEYLHAALNSRQLRRSISELAGGSAASMVNISKAKLRAFQLPLPSYESQEVFAARISELAHVRELRQKAIRESNALLQSLQSRAFRGEL